MSGLAAAAAFVCGLPASAQPRTTLTLLPQSPFDALAVPTGIGNLGWVVGGGRTGSGPEQAIWWPRGDLAQALPTLGGAAATATAIGGLNIVGASQTAGGQIHAFSYNVGTRVMRDLGTLGGVLSMASSVDGPSGRVVGLSTLANGQQRAFLFDPAIAPGSPASLRDLGTLGGTSSSARDIAGNWVVGQSTDVSGVQHAFVWDEAGGMRALGTAGESSQAVAVNGNGLVVGQVVVGGQEQPFLWTPGGRMQVIQAPGDAYGADVNDAGQVLVRRSGGGSSWFWTATGGGTELHTLADAGVSTFEAAAINEHVQIVGTASGTLTGQQARPAVLTLHPDWQGGDGAWNDSTGQHWNWAGTGTAAVTVGALHDVVIDPGQRAVVTAGNGQARSLRLGGQAAHAVVLDMTQGQILVAGDVRVAAGGQVRGGGALSANVVQIDAGGGLLSDAGSVRSLTVVANGGLYNDGVMAARGDAVVGRSGIGVEGRIFNRTGGQIDLSHGGLIASPVMVNEGTVLLADASISVGLSIDPANPGLLNSGTGALRMVSGASLLFSNGVLHNLGVIDVGAGASLRVQAEVLNEGRLHVADGGRASFMRSFASVSSISGRGQLRFDAGLATGAAATAWITIEPQTIIGAVRPAGIALKLGGVLPGSGADRHDKFSFSSAVSLEGGVLDLRWWDGHTGQLGDSYDLFDWNGGISGSFGSLALPTLASGLSWDTSDLYLGGSLGVTAVPEPATWLMWLAAAVVAGTVRRAQPAR